ncbi:DUF2235 domain-containing protein [Demequina sp. SYSU T00192]|uniref:DUF2235 domain-containing protein n=1 Tax=Demequina litoralis TaxID=3051660 RepID=A0ABT8G6A7_9MICO|nr:DUF2235 domain-containing protein [Demequina sp. SYSU T00192]MDN4474675.1 DUF2235 domain-containing protein [Demequina sp. SYSU T00192]
MKRIVVCCDGTWNKPDQARPTNVVKIALAVAPRGPDGVEQRTHYLPGVGTRRGEIIRGGAFGWGLSRAVREAYTAVADDYEPGDEIFLLGYSRGAYTARSAAGFLRNAGILRPEHRDRLDEAYALYRSRSKSTAPGARKAELFRRSYAYPDLAIRFVGVFDTVGSLGIPGSSIPIVRWFNKRWSFHDTQLSRSVTAAYQALAIDEQRTTFQPTLWDLPEPAPGQVLEQAWFAGCHSNVGGGAPDTGLSDLALGWIARMAAGQGLAFANGAFVAGRHLEAGDATTVPFVPDALGPIGRSRTGIFKLWPPYIRPIGEKEHGNESLASSAVARHAARPTDQPENLIEALTRPHRVTEV